MPWRIFRGLNAPVVEYARQVRTELFVDAVLDGQHEHSGFFCGQMHDVIPRLRRKVISAGTDLERINEVDRLFSEIRFYRKLEKLYLTRLSKSTKVAIMFVNRARDFLDTSDDDKALACYNLALAFLPIEFIVQKGISVFENRAYLLFKFHDHEGFATDAHSSLGLAGSLTLETCQALSKVKCSIEKSKTERERCPELVNKQTYMRNVVFKIKDGKSSRIPLAAHYISVLYETAKGRFLVTNKDIEPGTTVIVEDPYVAGLDNACNWRWRNCSRCLKAMLQVYPCLNCTFAMYCSDDCMHQDMKEGHKYECPCMNFMHAMGFEYFEILALKAICKAGPHELYKLFQKEMASIGQQNENENGQQRGSRKPKQKVVIPGFDPETGIYDSSSYLTIHKLATHELADASYLTAVTWVAIGVSKILEGKTDFFDKIGPFVKDEFRRFVASCLLRNFNSFQYNALSLHRQRLPDYMNYPFDANVDADEYNTSGIYPLLSLINHSCDPNILLVQMPGTKGKLAAIALRVINAGEQLTISYGWTTYDAVNFPRRVSYLKKFYKIEHCNCFACVYRWPAVSDYPDVGIINGKPPTKHLCPLCANNETLSHEFRSQNCYVVRNGKHLAKCCHCSTWFDIHSLTKHTSTCMQMNEEARTLIGQGESIQAIGLIFQTIKYFQARLATPNHYLLESQKLLELAYSKITE